MAKALMIQGTGSNAGKSLITAGLCRIFSQKGFRVAPFKSQNMALNSYVTNDSLEMGRAQATQAFAANIQPDIRMNPVLLKPTADNLSQVIVMGKPIGNMHFREYMTRKAEMMDIATGAFNSLAAEFDILIIEGAGSPAEVNLRDYDFVNMKTAEMANAPVIIVGDIDRGGVFASLIGTMELLNQEERNRVGGFIINKFRGDPSFLDNGTKILEEKTGKKTYGIVPMIRELNIPEEDAVPLELRNNKHWKDSTENKICIAVVGLPHLSNFTDFDQFLYEPDIDLSYTRLPGILESADIIILPGSKNVAADLDFLNRSGLTAAIQAQAALGKKIIGICGGYQMLGKRILDPHSIESASLYKEGLGLLDLSTVMESDKILNQTEALCLQGNIQVKGYEIHHGRTVSNEQPFFVSTNGNTLGSISKSGNIWGTYLHGVFENDTFRSALLNQVRENKGLETKNTVTGHLRNYEFDRLAQILSDSLKIKDICQLMGVAT